MIEKHSGPTLVDVAREANISLKTASRVLNAEDGVASDTAARVRSVMLRMGYRPNELARGLKGRKSAAIGIVVPNLADPFCASAVQSVQEVARSRGHVVIITSSDGEEALEREELEMLVRRQVDGLIIAPADGRRITVGPFLSANIPIVTFDRPFAGTGIDSITVTNEYAVSEATEHLISHGYRHILAIGARPDLYTGSERVKGYVNTMKRARLKKRTFLVDHESKLTHDVIRTLLTGSDEKIEAILTLNGITTMLVLRALRSLGLQVGEGIALVSFDDFDLAEILNPGLTVVCQPAAELGRRAAELLFTRMEGGTSLPPQNIVLSTSFHIRGSCGCPA